MVVTCVHVSVRPDNVRDFIDAMIENHRGSVEEAGNLRFDVLQQADEPCKFMIYEVFESEEAVRKHKETDHYIRWRDRVKEFMDGDRYGVRYNVIEPSDRSAW